MSHVLVVSEHVYLRVSVRYGKFAETSEVNVRCWGEKMERMVFETCNEYITKHATEYNKRERMVFETCNEYITKPD